MLMAGIYPTLTEQPCMAGGFRHYVHTALHEPLPREGAGEAPVIISAPTFCRIKPAIFIRRFWGVECTRHGERRWHDGGYARASEA